MSTPSRGLEGVIAAQTAISAIDGTAGRLSYRGIDIDELVEQSSFEETTALLWYGDLPTAQQLASFQRKMAENRLVPNEVIALLLLLPKSTSPMSVLRTAVSALAPFDPETGDNSLDANVHKSIRLTAAIPTIVAAWERIRKGLWPVTPDASLGHAANFLYMLSGTKPDSEAARILDQCLILHADHSLNASTFAARIAASTLAHLHSAIVSAIGTLEGSLHGGANEQVMRMLLEIGTAERTEQYLRGAFASGKKIMGFGHRVYTADDPRAIWLGRLAARLAAHGDNARWYQLSERIRTIVQAETGLPVNVDFYSAPVYYTLGIPLDLFTPIFALSRVAGWTAHVYEQYADNRLIRPDANYIGPRGVPYIPLHRRSSKPDGIPGHLL